MTLQEKYLIFDVKIDLSKVAGGTQLPQQEWLNYELLKTKSINTKIDKNVDLIKNVIHPDDCKSIINFFEKSGTYTPVTIQGLQEVTEDNIGSNRITGVSSIMAHDIFNVIKKHLEKKVCHILTPTDWWQQQNSKSITYKPIACSPLLRFMKYVKGGTHYPHYDAGYIYSNPKYRTLKSFVLYLTTNQSGATRIIKDKQSNLPIWNRNHNDWDRPPVEDEVLFKSLPNAGDMFVFDHRICHDVEPFTDEGDRIIIRGDIVYKSM